MGKKSNNTLSKENRNKSISISPKNVSISEKNNSMIRPALKSNSKKIKNADLKVRRLILNANNDSSIPAATVSKTYRTREVSVALEQSDVVNKMVANIAAKIKDVEMSPELKPKKEKDGLELKTAKSIEKNGIAGTTEPKKTKNNKSVSPRPMKTKSIKRNCIADQIKDVEMSQQLKKPKKDKSGLEPKNAKSVEKPNKIKQELKKLKKEKGGLEPKNAKIIEKHNKIKDVEMLPELKKAKKEKGGLEPKNATSIKKHGIAGKKKDVEMFPEAKKEKKKKGKSSQSMDAESIEKNGIAGKINDFVNLEQSKKNTKCVTIDQLKDSINLQTTRLYEMKRKKRLEIVKKKRTEKMGIASQIQDLENLEKLDNLISVERKKMKNLKSRLIIWMKKDHTSQDKTSQVRIRPPDSLEDRLNKYIKKKLVLGTETIIGINTRIGLLANISAWSELLADLPDEDRVMFFEPPSLLVSFLSECEPLLPLRQVIKDLGLQLQKEQEKKELEQDLMPLQMPVAILEDNGPSLPPTDDSKTKEDVEPVPMLKLEETDNSEEEEKEEEEEEEEEEEDDEEKEEQQIPQKMKQKGFRRTNYDEQSDSWSDSSSDESVEFDDGYDPVDAKIEIIIQDLEICDIVNLKNEESVTNDASCLRSDNYFSKPVGNFLIGIGSGLAREYFQRDMLREHKHRLHEQKELEKPCDSLKKAIHFLGENLQMTAEANFGFKFKQKKCRFCDFQSESMHTMALHMNSPHNIMDDKFMCNYCNIGINSSSVTLQHMESVHGIAGHLEPPLPEIPCPLCPFDLKVAYSAHPKFCLQKFDINRNLIPECWDLPAKIMPVAIIKCPDEVVDDFRTFLSLKSSMETGSADCAQTTTENLKVEPAVAAGESITITDPVLVTPACDIKGLPQTEKSAL